MLFNQDRVNTIVDLLKGSSSEELHHIVAMLSSDYATNQQSTMGTMKWLFVTAPADRLDSDDASYREQAYWAGVPRN